MCFYPIFDNNSDRLNYNDRWSCTGPLHCRPLSNGLQAGGEWPGSMQVCVILVEMVIVLPFSKLEIYDDIPHA